MILVNTHEAKSKLSFLLAKVENDREKIIICKNGKPVAELVPIDSTSDPLIQDPELMGVKYISDPTLPLDEEDWPQEQR